MLDILKWLRDKLLEVLPAITFFLVAFNLIVLTDALAAGEYGLRPFSFVRASIAAVLVGKAVLLANFIPFVNAFPDKPLICNTLWKAFLYTLSAFLVRYAARLLVLTIRYGNVAAANRHLISDVDWPRFWAIQIWVAVLFLVFAAAEELGRVLGRGRLRRMFIGH